MKTILMVDDDDQLRSMFCLALRKNGYHVIEAKDGLSGLQMARQHLPDLILTDLNMPNGDGSTLLRDIRHDPELRSKQVVFITGRPDVVTPRKGMEEGADDFLVKPVSLDALLKCVEARFHRASINWRVQDQMLTQLRSFVPSHLPHEFFTPLAGIIGLMEILRSDSHGLEPAEIRDIHEDVYQSALRLNHTLRNYLLILDVQNFAPVPDLAALGHEDLLDSIQSGVVEALRLNRRSDDVEMEIQPSPILVAAENLSRIVEELVDNALKFSRQGSPVKVELRSDGSLVITDKGRGLTAESIRQIAAFQQFDRKKNEQQGLGLGLILVQKLIAQCGARISILSEPGVGTEVTITFNLAKPIGINSSEIAPAQPVGE